MPKEIKFKRGERRKAAIVMITIRARKLYKADVFRTHEI